MMVNVKLFFTLLVMEFILLIIANAVLFNVYGLNALTALVGIATTAYIGGVAYFLVKRAGWFVNVNNIDDPEW